MKKYKCFLIGFSHIDQYVLCGLRCRPFWANRSNYLARRRAESTTTWRFLVTTVATIRIPQPVFTF